MYNKNYPPYSIKEITNLKQIIYDFPSANDKIAFVCTKGRKQTVEITYDRFRQNVEEFGTYLYENNIKNTHIAVLGENSYEWILTYFSAVSGGNVIVPIDKELSDREIINMLVVSDSSVLVYSPSYLDIAKELSKQGLDILCISISDIPEILRKGRNLIKSGKREFIEYEVDRESLAAIVYTSGTTGASKGVMLTHGNIASNAVAACKNVYAAGGTLCVLPLHHTFSFTLGICAILMYRDTIYICSSLKNIVSDMQRAKPLYILLVPMIVEAMYKKIWDTARSSGRNKMLKILIKVSNVLSMAGIDVRRRLFASVIDAFGGRLEWVSCGGAAIDTKYIKGFRDFGINIINGYGITECSPIVAANNVYTWKDGSVGRVLSCNEVKIDNPNEDGEGEILVKGASVMKGYYKDEEATRNTFADGWFKTGDIGKYENEFLYITGRCKNVIILSNGKNIYPEELELELMNIDGISECMVYEEDNRLTAEIYSDSLRSEEDIRESIHALNRILPVYKQIVSVKFRKNEFEKTTTKKIKRR